MRASEQGRLLGNGKRKSKVGRKKVVGVQSYPKGAVKSER